MAENKKSFIAYCDWLNTFEELPDDKAGQLIKHLLRYVNDLDPKSDDILINAVFANIKQTLKRDLIKYEEIKVKRSESGKKGGRPKKQTKAKKPNAFLEKQTKAKKAVSDNVSDSVNVINKNIYRSFAHLEITIEENKKLLDIGYNQKQIDDIYDSIENYNKNNQYKSLYLTAKKWLNKETPIDKNKKLIMPY